MESKRTDFLVGIFILVTIGVMVGTVIVTSGLGKVHHDLYMRTETAQDLTSDTRVFLQGLAVGRVRQVNPQVDSTTGALRFVALLLIDERFPDGTLLQLPVGTTGLISQQSVIADPIVQLVTPPGTPGRVALAAGDTIDSRREVTALEQLGAVASKLENEVSSALEDVRQLIVRTTGAVDRTSRAVTQANQMLTDAAPLVDTVLRRLASSLERTDRVLAAIEPRSGPMQDSLMVTVGRAHALLIRFDSLAGTAQTMVEDNQDAIRNVAHHLQRTAEMLEHFTDQVSRRPTRLFTGVKPRPVADSVRTP